MVGSRLRISGVRITPASTRDKRTGLRAYVSFLVDDRLRVDGVTVRLTAEGQPVLSFPARTDHCGIERPYVWPIDQAARREVEEAVFTALGYRGGSL